MAWAAMIFAFLIFLISYANYPDDVLIYINAQGEPLQYIAKDMLFYSALAFAIIINSAFLGLHSILKKVNSELQLTLSGLSLSQLFFNLFFATSLYFVNILNSRENFDYSNFGYLIYVTGTLFLLGVIFTLVARVVLKK